MILCHLLSICSSEESDFAVKCGSGNMDGFSYIASSSYIVAHNQLLNTT